MKKLTYSITLATLLFMAGCKTESDQYFDTPYKQFKVQLDYYSPNTEYEVQFGSSTFKMGNLSNLPSWNPTLPADMFDAQGRATNDLKVWTISKGIRSETPERFHVTLKADTTIRFRHAAGDRLRLLSTPEDEQQYITLGIMEKFLPENYNYAITFNDELLKISRFEKAYFHKDHVKGTLRFYERKGNNLANSGFDATGLEPELTLTDYTVTNDAMLALFKPLGGKLTIWRDEDADKYATLMTKIVYGSNTTASWKFKLGEDDLSGSGVNYVDKSSLSKSIKVYKVQNATGQSQLYSEIPGPFTNGQVLEYILEGEELVPNSYVGPDPSKRTASFLKFGYLYAASGRIKVPSIRVKVYLAEDGVKSRLLKEFQIDGRDGATVYTDPFEMDMAELCPAGPMPDDNYLYMPGLFVEVSNAATGANLTGNFGSNFMEPLIYGKMDDTGNYVWPFQLTHKQASIVLNGQYGNMSFIYPTGAW